MQRGIWSRRGCLRIVYAGGGNMKDDGAPDFWPGFWFELATVFQHFTDRSRRVIDLAKKEAIGRRRNYLLTTDILLGLAKEGRGVGAAVLSDVGLDLIRIRDEVDKISQQTSSEEGEAQAGGPPLAR